MLIAIFNRMKYYKRFSRIGLNLVTPQNEIWCFHYLNVTDKYHWIELAIKFIKFQRTTDARDEIKNVY